MFKLLLMVVTVSLFFTVPAPFSRSHWNGAYLKFGSQEPNNMIDLSNENENHHTTAAVCVCVCLFHSKLNECIKNPPEVALSHCLPLSLALPPRFRLWLWLQTPFLPSTTYTVVAGWWCWCSYSCCWSYKAFGISTVPKCHQTNFLIKYYHYYIFYYYDCYYCYCVK